jgi:hypothetical protein
MPFSQTFPFIIWVNTVKKEKKEFHFKKPHLLGENNFGILKKCQSSGRALSWVGGRVGYRTPGCVQVLVSGAEDLARTACSTFP